MQVSSFERMKINMHKLDVLESELGCRLILEREDIGEEVGFPEVETVGLYRGTGGKNNTLYYIDADRKIILETFVVQI